MLFMYALVCVTATTIVLGLFAAANPREGDER